MKMAFSRRNQASVLFGRQKCVKYTVYPSKWHPQISYMEKYLENKKGNTPENFTTLPGISACSEAWTMDLAQFRAGVKIGNKGPKKVGKIER